VHSFARSFDFNPAILAIPGGFEYLTWTMVDAPGNIKAAVMVAT
jgi:hypothetical protein